MKKEPLVSIALATYNGEKFLEKQLESLLLQTYKNLEIIVSDDGSQDRTIQILEKFKQQDVRINYSKNKNPSGFKKNFERAIKLCDGDFIFLCDQDDIWYPEKIEKHLEEYSNPEISWVYNEVDLVDAREKKMGTLDDFFPEYYKKIKLLNRTGGRCILGCATSYRSSLIKNIWPISEHAPSHDSWIQLFMHSKKTSHLKSKLQMYRQHESNVFGIKPPGSDNVLKNIEKSILYVKDLCKDRKLDTRKRFALFVLFILKNINYKIRKLMEKII